jgi:hypothetical protein
MPGAGTSRLGPITRYRVWSGLRLRQGGLKSGLLLRSRLGLGLRDGDPPLPPPQPLSPALYAMPGAGTSRLAAANRLGPITRYRVLPGLWLRQGAACF